MKGVAVAAFAASIAAVGTEALQLKKRDPTAPPRVVHFPIERRTNERHVMSSRLRKRQTVSQTLDNFEQGSLYFANVTMGTPPQNFRFHVDTGSSDLWANSATSDLCTGRRMVNSQDDESCSVSGTYNANDSSTYNIVSSDFVISYADNSGAQGDYVTDTLRFGDQELKDLQFGVGYESTSPEGVMGIGFPGLEVQAIINQKQPYANIPQKMVEEGLIGTAAYSLWLDDLFSSTGNILFGGVDQNKYVGELKTLDVAPVQGMLLEMEVQLDQINFIDENNSNQTILSNPITVLLDSGSTLSYLPVNVASTIYDAVGARFFSEAGAALCSCDVANSSATMDFIFDGKVIEVRMAELVLPGGVGSAASSLGCVFGIMPQESGSSSGASSMDSSYTLGDTFIRNAYIVYDVQNGQISLAQTNFESTSTNIMEIANSTHVADIEGNGTNDQSNTDAAAGLRPTLIWALVISASVVFASGL